MLWHGGSSYAAPTINDAESFASLAEAKRDFISRLGNPYYPCVTRETEENGGPSAWIFYGTEAGDYPDSVLSFGPRGGLQVRPA